MVKGKVWCFLLLASLCSFADTVKVEKPGFSQYLVKEYWGFKHSRFYREDRRPAETIPRSTRDLVTYQYLSTRYLTVEQFEHLVRILDEVGKIIAIQDRASTYHGRLTSIDIGVSVIPGSVPGGRPQFNPVTGREFLEFKEIHYIDPAKTFLNMHTEEGPRAVPLTEFTGHSGCLLILQLN